ALGDALTQLRALAFARASARLEKLLLAGHGARRAGFIAALGQVVGKRDFIGAVALSFEPGLAREQLVELCLHHAESSARHRIVQPDQNLPFLDGVALVNEDFADDTAGRMLHLLNTGFDNHRSRRDHSASKLARRSPNTEASEQ